MEKLDLTQFDQRFENLPEPIGNEQSEIDQQRDIFIAENSLTYVPSPAVPSQIAGTPKNLNQRPDPHIWKNPPRHKELVPVDYFDGKKREHELPDPEDDQQPEEMDLLANLMLGTDQSRP